MAGAVTGLVDQYGRPIRSADLKREIAGPELAGVRQVLSDHPAQGLTPERLAGLLRDAEQGDAVAYLELAEEMEERDLHYLAVLGQRKRGVSQLEVTVEAASDAAEDVVAADLVRDWLNRDSIEDELFALLDAIGKGFAAAEILWDLSERQWWPQRLVWRDPRWFAFDRHDGVTPLLRSIESAALSRGGEPLPAGKFIVHTHAAKSGIPVRGGLARAVAWFWLFRHFAIRDWVQFCAVFGMPLRLGKYHEGASEDDKRVLLRAVSQIANDAAAIIPETMLVEFPSVPATQGTDVFKSLAEYLDHQVSKAVLGQSTTTDAISGGHAVSQEHNEVRLDILQSDAKQLAATLNRDLVVPFVGLNLGPKKRWPRIRIDLREEKDISALVDNVAKLVPLGLRVEQSVMMDKLGLPDPDAGAVLLGASPAAPVSPGDATAPLPERRPGEALPRPALNAQAAQRADRDALDGLVEAAIAGDGWEPLVAPLVAPIERLVADAASLEEVRDRLAETVARMDTAALEALLARAGLTARLAGYSGAPVSDPQEEAGGA